jgi:hypothetical protein
MKQIGLAIHNYHTRHGVFPMNTTGSPKLSSGACGNGFYSWLALILPDMEQGGLYESINFKVGMMDTCGQTRALDYQELSISSTHPNAKAAATVVSAYLCPSMTYELNDVAGSAKTAPGSYAGNLGWPRRSMGISGELLPTQHHNGLTGVINPSMPDAWQQGAVSASDVTDGLSNTAAVAERLITSIIADNEVFGMPESLRSYCGGSGGIDMSFPLYVEYCNASLSPDASFSKYQGRAWISGWTLVANTYMHTMPINQRSCHLHGGEDDGNNITTPSSNHPGGINVLMGDGTVHFVNESIDMKIWWSIGSRNGGETYELP